MGSIYSGLVTPIEAAAVGCLLAMAIAMIRGEFNFNILMVALKTSVRVRGNILFIVYAAFVFSYAISYAGVGEQITRFLVDLKLSRLEFFLALLPTKRSVQWPLMAQWLLARSGHVRRRRPLLEAG
jgi:TRAP-type C4-dicarboxylate transport system permease large subunit